MTAFKALQAGVDMACEAVCGPHRLLRRLVETGVASKLKHTLACNQIRGFAMPDRSPLIPKKPLRLSKKDMEHAKKVAAEWAATPKCNHKFKATKLPVLPERMHHGKFVWKKTSHCKKCRCRMTSCVDRHGKRV
jgi:hypothetical protein